jgi:membrane-associated phospholipid phosphatase
LTPRAAFLLAALLLVTFTGPAHAAAEIDSLGALPHHDSFVTRRDVRLAFAATAGVILVSVADQNISHEAPESNSGFARDVAHGAEHGGNPAMIAPFLGAAWLAGKVTGNPGLSASSLRIAGGIAAAATVSSGIKYLAGRSRPYESPDDPDEFRAFSGHTAFPSGHTTVAFSLASGIDHETTARWVPFVVYPLAGLVGWSRLRDNRHWASDVLAGAFVGTWTTHKFQRMVNGENARLSIEIAPGAAGATYHF